MGFWLKLLFHLKKTEHKNVVLPSGPKPFRQQFYWLVLGRIRKYFISPAPPKLKLQVSGGKTHRFTKTPVSENDASEVRGGATSVKLLIA